MVDERAFESSASRLESERSHTRKAYGSAKLKSVRYFLYGPVEPYPGACSSAQKVLKTRMRVFKKQSASVSDYRNEEHAKRDKDDRTAAGKVIVV